MKPDATHTANPAIRIYAYGGLNNYSIEMIQAIESAIDKSLMPLGFSRTTTTKAGDFFELNYRQFGIAT